MAVDLGVFQRQKTLLEQQQLQDAFELKKQLGFAQAAAAIKQLNAPELGVKDILTLQLAQQNQQENRDLRREAMDQQFMIARLGREDKVNLDREKRDEKINQKFLNDQNLLGNSTAAIDKQLALIDTIEKGENATGDELNVGGNFGLMSKVPNIPGSKAANAEALLKQLDAQTFLGTLQNIKDQSKTGASGFGALTEREGDKVQSAAAALQRSQDFNSFKSNLGNYKTQLQETKERLQGNFRNIYKDRVPEVGGTVVVMNPQTNEALEIDANDLQDALSEGWVQR